MNEHIDGSSKAKAASDAAGGAKSASHNTWLPWLATLLVLIIGICTLAWIVVPEAFETIIPPSREKRTVELMWGLRLIDAAADQWAIEQGMVAADMPLPQEIEPYISRRSGWIFQWVPLDQLFSGTKSPLGYARAIVQFRKPPHFLNDWRDPFGNPYVLSDLTSGTVAVHPRSLHTWVNVSEKTVPHSYLPDRRNPEFKRQKQTDLLESIYRAARIGNAEKLREFLHLAGSAEPDYRFAPASGSKWKYSLKGTLRTAEERDSELRTRTLPEAVAEAESIRDSAASFLAGTNTPSARKFYETEVRKYEKVLKILKKASERLRTTNPELR